MELEPFSIPQGLTPQEFDLAMSNMIELIDAYARGGKKAFDETYYRLMKEPEAQERAGELPPPGDEPV